MLNSLISITQISIYYTNLKHLELLADHIALH